LADSQFAPDWPYYVKTDFLEQRRGQGHRVDQRLYKAENPGEVTVVLGTHAGAGPTPPPRRCWPSSGLDAEITVQQKTSEQSKFVLEAATGQFEADLWRQFGAADPELANDQRRPGPGKNATGALAPELRPPQWSADQRSAGQGPGATPDEAVRKQAYAEVQKRQTEPWRLCVALTQPVGDRCSQRTSATSPTWSLR